MVKIYIDSGHGGTDSGATGNRLKEKDLTLKIGNEIAKQLKKYENVLIKQSRTTDKTLSLKHRTDEANKWGADLFLSIHINAGKGTGFESFINVALNSKNDRNNTIGKRKILHDEIMKELSDIRNRGMKKANFHVVRESKMSAILTENLFIDTKSDANKLKDNQYIKKIAKGHVNGLVKIYKLKKKKQTSNKNNRYYRVVAGSYQDRKNADKQIKKLKNKGFDSFIIIYDE